MRDRAFNIFYMGINVGAMFAPTASERSATGSSPRPFHLRCEDPRLANDFLKGRLADAGTFWTSPGPGPGGHPGHAREVCRNLYQHPEQVLSLRLRRGLHQPRHLDDGLLGLPEALCARGPHGKAEGEVALHKAEVVTLTPQETKERLLAWGWCSSSSSSSGWPSSRAPRP